MGKFSLGPIIMFFVVIILGVVFLREIGDNQVKNTELSGVTNESIAITMTNNVIINETITIASGIGTTGNSSIQAVGFFGNATNSTHLDDVAINAQVNFTKAGAIVVAPDHIQDGDYNISYNYTSDGVGNTVQDDLTSLDFFGNGTNSTHLASITAGANVNFTKPGVISVDTMPFDPGTYNISYGFEGDLYVVDTKSHPLLKLLSIFFVLTIFAFGIQTIMKSSDDFNFGFGKVK